MLTHTFPAPEKRFRHCRRAASPLRARPISRRTQSTRRRRDLRGCRGPAGAPRWACRPPRPPRLSRVGPEAGVEGMVVVQFVVDEDGGVADPIVSPHAIARACRRRAGSGPGLTIHARVGWEIGPSPFGSPSQSRFDSPGGENGSGATIPWATLMEGVVEGDVNYRASDMDFGDSRTPSTLELQWTRLRQPASWGGRYGQPAFQGLTEGRRSTSECPKGSSRSDRDYKRYVSDRRAVCSLSGALHTLRGRTPGGVGRAYGPYRPSDRRGRSTVRTIIGLEAHHTARPRGRMRLRHHVDLHVGLGREERR